MIETLLPIAVKSFVVAGVALLLLRLASGRSAAERSWIAHLGLVATLLLPVAATFLPAIQVTAPAFLTAAQPAAPSIEPLPVAVATSPTANGAEAASTAATFPVAGQTGIAAIDWALWLYALPAALLLLLTLIALVRLFVLQARARVMVEPNWLTALAQAQQRMGFKHGTALLISDELPSPVSWGLLRPVILLNSRAAQATDEAEAIIAHELAHVARLDWLKLLLSRVAVAAYWFNPLVWVLAREAHQLREETADDAVLAANIVDTDYAQLLVGVARHECRGMFVGAHGVAPSKGSLARRVARVLDPGSVRRPAAGGFALGVLVGATVIAAPLAAISLVPADEETAPSRPIAKAGTQAEYYPAQSSQAEIDRTSELTPDVDAEQISRDVQQQIQAEMTQVRTAGRDRTELNAFDRMIGARALGATPAYGETLRAAAPQLGRLDEDALVELRAVGVTPDYIRDLARFGHGRLSADELVEAKALGIDGRYIQGLASVGVRGTMDELVEMKALGVTPADVAKLRQAGFDKLTPEQIVQFKAVGGGGGNLDVNLDINFDHDDDGGP